jgi:hypothetical protein
MLSEMGKPMQVGHIDNLEVFVRIYKNAFLLVNQKLKIG